LEHKVGVAFRLVKLVGINDEVGTEQRSEAGNDKYGKHNQHTDFMAEVWQEKESDAD